MDEWENALGVLWDTRGPDRQPGSWLASAARRAADVLLVESTRPEAEYWPLLLPLPPRNATRVVAAALSASTLAPFAAAAPMAVAADGVQIQLDSDAEPDDQTPPEAGDTGDEDQPPPPDENAAIPQATPALVAPAATVAPTGSANPAADQPADGSAPAIVSDGQPQSAAGPASNAAPTSSVAAEAVTPAPTEQAPAEAATPVSPEPTATARTEPVPVATTPRLVPSRPGRPARRHHNYRVSRLVEPAVTMHVTPRRTIASHQAPTASTVTLRVALGPARRSEVRAGKLRTRYRVRPGDSLWRIAQSLLGPRAGTARVVTTVHVLWALNGRRVASGDPDLLTTSDVLLIPARKELR